MLFKSIKYIGFWFITSDLILLTKEYAIFIVINFVNEFHKVSMWDISTL